MIFSTLLSLTPLLGAVSAQSQSQAADAFTLNLRWSNSPLNGPLNANRGGFWIGKPTAAYYPDNIPHCPTANTTSFVAQDGKLFLNTAVPGGQQVYVSPTGELTYTVPHSAYIPEGSLTDLEIFSTTSFLNPFLTLWLCDADESAVVWRVWFEYTNATTGAITNNGLTGKNACTRIALEAKAYAGPKAWSFA
ncbi:uncharacterized protein ACLA_002340 [Aspergillus clavatus NRRL 1]|uniref:IgE-binding protein n=1 Tax=Aspergillus clavatus (strain ATCC 1007 / CBS 513.65 / DSM 816 / NCTC 3887 / NRRL 1 / QM 1276 / 107) TaxID=344612 RepID=A1C555_ASPCL|nr:uncharacterized protein ACLA_002340 [Aspergillus clavatus NRRL 1]EAW14823.1 conserved hypothetical protein [Aspergillus clavatus NRRL 1]